MAAHYRYGGGICAVWLFEACECSSISQLQAVGQDLVD
jgi:hypothetical protein